MTVTCEHCHRQVLTDQTAEVLLVYRHACPVSSRPSLRVQGAVPGGRFTIRDAAPDEIVTVNA